MKEMEDVKKKAAKARDAIREVCKEFAPAGEHAVGAGKEVLLAMREVIDAEIRLLEKGRTKAKPKPTPKKSAAPKGKTS